MLFQSILTIDISFITRNVRFIGTRFAGDVRLSHIRIVVGWFLFNFLSSRNGVPGLQLDGGCGSIVSILGGCAVVAGVVSGFCFLFSLGVSASFLRFVVYESILWWLVVTCMTWNFGFLYFLKSSMVRASLGATLTYFFGLSAASLGLIL